MASGDIAFADGGWRVEDLLGALQECRVYEALYQKPGNRIVAVSKGRRGFQASPSLYSVELASALGGEPGCHG